MALQQMYGNAKARLLSDASICEPNRALFAKFFEFEEYKLKRQNGIPALDNGCYQTLYGYTQRFRNVNRWFDNKPWADLTRQDIQRVYDAIEEGVIKTKAGLPYRDRASYYNKVFKSKPFRLAGKSELACDVIEFSTAEHRIVRYITEDEFRKLLTVVCKPHHLFLLWLAWDIGENINALLKLTKRDFIPQVSQYTGEREYIVNLPAAKLKRSRQSRSEITVHKETVEYADIVLTPRAGNDRVFACGYRSASKILERAVRLTRATTMPYGEKPRWKDFRSGMACHLLRNGWTREDVNARLGHTPHSDALDVYINFLALDRDAPKRRMRDLAAQRQQEAQTDVQQAAQLAADRLRREQEATRVLKAELERLRAQVELNRGEAAECATSDVGGVQ